MKHRIFALLIMCVLLFTGCSSKAEQVIAFQNELNSVITKMENIHKELESIDVTNKDASGQALEALSSLKDAFEELVAIEVKDEQFAFINDLAIEGSQYMEQAYKFFEEAYTFDHFDRETADLAYQYLERATKRINVIITMLHGEVPEGVVVH